MNMPFIKCPFYWVIAVMSFLSTACIATDPSKGSDIFIDVPTDIFGAYSLAVTNDINLLKTTDLEITFVHNGNDPIADTSQVWGTENVGPLWR